MSPQTTVQLPADLVQRLQQAGHEAGMDLPAYVLFLEQCRRGVLDAKAQDAVRFMLSKHGASLRKLAQ